MATKFDNPNLKIFRQHGFIPQGESGNDQVIGRCPFCGKDKHFYVNPETKNWDCKSCFHEGGYQKFLVQLLEHCQEKFTGKRARILAERRGLEIETLKEHKIGYNPINDTYIIPVWDTKQKEIYNLRIYKKKGDEYKELHNSTGCKAALYGWEGIDDSSYNEVYLLEGEWDRMAWWEVMNNLGLLTKKVRLLGAPGAGTFKPEWCGFFKGKKVHVMYDNDHETVKNGQLICAGKLGMKKVYNMLDGVAEELDFIHWPSHYDNGFDINDYYVQKKRCNAERTFKGVKSLLKDHPPEITIPEGFKEDEVTVPGAEHEKKEREPLTGPGLSPEEVYEGYRKWLHLPDVSILDMVFGAVLANRLSGEPLWVFLVGPASSGKSDIIMSLDKAPYMHPISSLTTKTLISGSVGPGGSDPSLAAKIDGEILSIKDLTELLSMNTKDRETIFGQLRNLFDGEAQKPFGTGIEKVYNVKFGLIAGVTEVIEMFTEQHSALGQRYVRAPMPVDRSLKGERDVLKQAFININNRDKAVMKEELREVAAACLNHDFGVQPKIPDSMVHKFICLSQWLARMRGTVEHDNYTKEITHLPFIEYPTRIFTQFSKWSYGITQFKHKKVVSEEVYNLMKQVAITSAPKRQEILVRNMYRRYKKKGKMDFTEADFSKMTGLPVGVCKQLSDALTIIGIFDKVRSPRGLGYNVELSEECINLIEEAEIY